MKNKFRHYFPAALALAVSAASAAAQMPPVVAEEKVPVVKLPPFNPVGVAKFDPVKAKAAPWDLQAVKVPEAWAKNPAAKGKGLKVVIHDTGCDVNHPGLHGMVKGVYNAIDKSQNVTDKHGHGTWCAGAVHAVVPEAELYIVKCLSDNGSGRVDQIAHGIDYATTNWKVDVHSLSLGGPDADTYQPAAIKRAVASGCVVVCAAGNDGPGDTEGYPGRYPESVSVAASTRDGKLAGFSSWGPNVFTVDPGENVTGLLPGGQQGEMSGTSMSCPKAAGKAASWIASNAIPKDADRLAKFRKAVIDASPFKERRNSIGYGLYTLDKITGTATNPPPPDKPTKPFSVTITLDDLSPEKKAELAAGGVTTFRLEVGHGDKAAGVADMPSVGVIGRPATSHTPPASSYPVGTVVYPDGRVVYPSGYPTGTVPGIWSQPVQPWYPPVPCPTPQTMPQRGGLLPYSPLPNVRHLIGAPVCGPGGCR